MHIPGRGACGAAACEQSAVKKTPVKDRTRRSHQVALSLQGPWATAANCSDKQAQGDDSGAAPQTHTTPKGVGMSDAMRPPARRLGGRHWWCLQPEREGRTHSSWIPHHHPLFPQPAPSC